MTTDPHPEVRDRSPDEPKDHKPGHRSTAFILCLAATIRELRNVAMNHGYALAVHGSMSRDFDLIACPWTPEAAPSEVLAEAIRKECRGFFLNDEAHICPIVKPHGRLAYKIYLETGSRGPYIDLSVMARLQDL